MRRQAIRTARVSCAPPTVTTRDLETRHSTDVLETHRAGDEDAHDLAGALADLEDLGVAVEAGHGELLHVAVAAVDLDGVAGGVGADLHVGDLEGVRLEAGDRLAEGLAFAGVAGALVDAAWAEAGGKGGHGDPALLEGAQEVGQAGAALAEGVGHRDP